MKYKSYRNFWLSLLNSYHVLLALYWILRELFGGAFWWLALLNTFALFVLLPLLLRVHHAVMGCEIMSSRKTRSSLSPDRPVRSRIISASHPGPIGSAILSFSRSSRSR